MADKEKDIHAGHRERMLKKYELMGADAFSDHELMEMLLYFSIPRCNTNETAHTLIRDFNGLYNALSSKYELICNSIGIGNKSALLVRLASDTVRSSELSHFANVPLHTFFRQTHYIFNWFKGKPAGTVMAIMLDKSKNLMTTVCLSKGKMMRADFYTEKVLDCALKNKAKYVILAHNHKNNIDEPSINDLYLTSEVRLSLESKNIKLLEHYIVTDNDCIPASEEIGAEK